MKRSAWKIGLVVLSASATAYGQTTWYVDDVNCNQGLGTGTLSDPFCSIQAGINAASNGDEVVLADGDYDEPINLLGKAITVRSTDPGDPVVVAGTVIDGFHLNTSVITCDSGEGPGTILNGLTIIRGNPLNGGGMTNANGSSPTVMNCVFSDNTAIGGGAKGGGMYNVNGSNPTVINCSFSNNEADHVGGGMYNANSNPIVTNCTFDGNDGAYGGGGMYNDNSAPMVTDCTFSGNDGHPGAGGMFNLNGSNPTVIDCTFSLNNGTGGGGMINDSGNATVTNCSFSENTATGGGGMSNKDSDTTLTNCMFIRNTATSGGGLNINAGDTTVTNCTFIENSATSGGGLSDYEGNAIVTNSMFIGNTATSGGGISTNNSSATVSNCSFSENYAFSLGGAMYMSESSSGGPSPIVSNCIFWGNDAMYNGNGAGSFEIWLGGFAAPAVDYCNIQGGFPGTANIDADPLFINAASGDFRLNAGSPCIDAADNTACPAGVTTDLDDLPRFMDDPSIPNTGVPGGPGGSAIVDMGAYEFQPESCYADCDQSTGAGVLDIFDFLCFQNSFVAGETYACDCDTSTGVGVCDIFDFLCFQNAFVAGCP